jgi:hypothetical protein
MADLPTLIVDISALYDD